MTDPGVSVPPRVAASTAPGPVVAAVLITIAAAAGTGVVALISAVGYYLVGRALLDNFDNTGSIVAWFFVIVATLLLMCAAAVVASLGLLMRRRWAWWALMALSVVTAVLGVVAGPYLLPLGLAAAASAVLVLLLVPSTRAWMAASRQ